MKIISLVCLAIISLALPAQAIQVVTGSYTGTGSDNTDITISPACQPVAVFARRDGTTIELFARFSSMGTDVSKDVTGGGAENTIAIKALNSNGFRLGTSTSVNSNGNTHYYVAICDNGANDIAVNTWTGDGTDNKNVSLSPSFTPELVLVLRSDSGITYWRGAGSHSGDSAVPMNSLNGNASNAIQSFSSGSFQVGTLLNTNLVTFYSLALKGSSGVSTGTFSGNTSDNRDITAITNPEFVMIKGDSSTKEPSYRFNLAGDLSWCSSATSAANIIQALQSTGFQVGTDSCANENGVTMLWFAIADFSSGFSILKRRY